MKQGRNHVLNIGGGGGPTNRQTNRERHTDEGNSHMQLSLTQNSHIWEKSRVVCITIFIIKQLTNIK